MASTRHSRDTNDLRPGRVRCPRRPSVVADVSGPDRSSKSPRTHESLRSEDAHVLITGRTVDLQVPGGRDYPIPFMIIDVNPYQFIVRARRSAQRVPRLVAGG